jgi:hypothetical protein
MKRSLLFFACLVMACVAFSQNAGYLTKEDFQSEKKKLTDNLNTSRKGLSDVKKILNEQKIRLDSLNLLLAAEKNNDGILRDSLDKARAQIAALTVSLQKKDSLSKGTTLLFFIIILALLVAAFILLGRLRQSTLAMNASVKESLDSLLRKTEQEKGELLGLLTGLREDLDRKLDAHHRENLKEEEDLRNGMHSEWEQALRTHEEQQAVQNSQSEKRWGEIGEKVAAFSAGVQKVKESLSSDLESVRNALKGELTKHTSDFHTKKA